MLSNVMKKVAGTGKIEQATDALTLQSNQPNVESTTTAPPDPPKVGMVMDASEFSFGFLPGSCKMFSNQSHRYLPKKSRIIFSVGDMPRFPYSRPEFLFLTTDDEICVSGDQTTRPVLVPKDPQKMLMFAGYAETINAGKTDLNEDHACCKLLNISSGGNFSSSADSRRVFFVC